METQNIENIGIGEHERKRKKAEKVTKTRGRVKRLMRFDTDTRLLFSLLGLTRFKTFARKNQVRVLKHIYSISRLATMHSSSFLLPPCLCAVFLGSPSVQAIYLDDELSGYEIYNNTFVNCHVCPSSWAICGRFRRLYLTACVVTRTVQNCGAKLRLAAMHSIIQHSTYHPFTPLPYSTPGWHFCRRRPTQSHQVQLDQVVGHVCIAP